MAIIKPYSVIYLIVSGVHKGRTCVLRERNGGCFNVYFAETKTEETALIRPGELAELEVPGWPEMHCYRPYSLLEHFESQKGTGSNMLRTRGMAQPRALLPNDRLATGQYVVDTPRMGFNSSSLVRLDTTGWIELAPRLPIALEGNERYKVPIELTTEDTLATGCRVVEIPYAIKASWVMVTLDQKDCKIEVPACVPLALT